MTPVTRGVERTIATIEALLNQHVFAVAPRDKPFCSCGWVGKPSDDWLTAERQSDKHRATILGIALEAD